MLDHSIYFKQPGSANIIGAASQGLTMGDMLKKVKNRNKEEKLNEELKNAYRNNTSINSDGKAILNKNSLLSDLMSLSPEHALEYQNSESQSELAKLRAEEARASRRLQDKKNRLDIKMKQKEFSDAMKPFSESREARKMAYQHGLKSNANIVPGVGVALNADDAKKLKDAKTMKEKFDRQIGELISLRKKHGVEYFDREAVGRGKQLSKDLLLTYKNLAKLGVLSKSDEGIVNAIIPSDPLGQDWMPGQDSILHQLEKFKGDIESDYASNLGARLKQSFAESREEKGVPSGYDEFSEEDIQREIYRRARARKGVAGR